MVNHIVRIESITIENFKNVAQGTIDFGNKRKEYKASILGLYGQNGSGKTALIDAIQLLKIALCGHSMPHKYADYVKIRNEIREKVGSYLYKETQCKPVILTVIQEI